MNKFRQSTFRSIGFCFLLTLGSTQNALAAGTKPKDTAPTDKLNAIFGQKTFDGMLQEDDHIRRQIFDQLVAIGLAENPSLRSEEESVAAAKAATEAAEAAYQPVAQVSASVGRLSSVESTEKTETSATTAQGSLSLRQNLWRGGADAQGIRSAEADEAIASLKRDEERATLIYQISQAALAYHSASIQKNIAAAAAADASEVLRLSERKFAAGQSGKLDVFRARMRSSEAKASAAKSEVQVAQAMHQLLKSLGRESGSDIAQVLAKLSSSPIPLPNHAPEDVTFGQTINEQVADHTKEKVNADYLRIRKSRLYPELDFVAGFSRTLSDTETSIETAGQRLKDADADKQNKLSLSLELTWPLWARPKDHQITQAWHERSAAEAKAEQTRIVAFHSKKAILAQLKALYVSLPAQQDAFNQANELYQSQRKLYDVGAIDVFAVNDADSQRVTALGN